MLGSHVNQAGSYVGPDRLHFDFSHFSQVTPEELAKVEKMVNEQILAAKTVTFEEGSVKNTAPWCGSLPFRISLWNCAAAYM